ncbi:MAG: hypothetical protein H0X24_02860, partial [Ktedonobacterales bacterium]|nr:hypothetical protein [Ktedonobacterales bacterium]
MRRHYQRRRVARGQALVLFALSISALIGLVGLSVDGLRVYIAFSDGQRAAEAAALAGVAYLPQYLTNLTPAPDGNDATTRALAAAAQNGFSNAAAITVAPVVGSGVPELHVIIRITVPLSLMAVLGAAPAVAQPNATAALLPPIALGDGSASFGDTTEGFSAQLAAISGSDELKERGDPTSPLCETGWSDGSDTAHTNATTPLFFTGLLHVPTNAPQYLSGPNCSPGTPGNPDVVPTGFGGLATGTTPVPTGTSYLITLPPGGTNYSVWVWNPRFTATGSGSDNQFFTNENVFSGVLRDNPQFYPRIAYSLYSAPQLYDRTRDVPLAAIWPNTTPPDTSPNPALLGGQLINLPSVDTNILDLIVHGCPWTGAWNLTGGSSYQLPITSGQGCLAAVPADYRHWVQLGTQALNAPTNGAGYFRLTVDTATGVGLHGYAVKVCQGASVAAGCAGGGATITPWNAATVQLHG